MSTDDRELAQRIWDRVCDALGHQRSELPADFGDELEELEAEQLEELEDLDDLEDLED